MASYPFLYSVAISVLQKLDQCNLEKFGNPDGINKDKEMLKRILTHLPSILETQESASLGNPDDMFSFTHPPSILKTRRESTSLETGESAYTVIRKSVFGLHDLLNKPFDPSLKSCWSDLVHPLTKFQDHVHPQSSENLLSYASFPLLNIESKDVRVKSLPPHLVPCVVYCAVYPRNPRIVRETLVNQWMAEGFLELQTKAVAAGGSSNEEMELEDIGNGYFMELLSMGVFVKPMFRFGGNHQQAQAAVTLHSCQIYPPMHDWARQIASKEGLVITNRYDFQKFFSFSGEEDVGKIPSMSFRLGRHREQHLPGPQSLDFTGTLCEDLPAGSLQKTGRLRYLAFSWKTRLERIDNIDWSSMTQLQTLSLDRCDRLKKVNLTQQSCLRNLYYTSKDFKLEIHTSTLRILQLSECPELRSLSLSNFANFKALRRLRVFKCPRLASLPDSIDLLPNVEELVFHNCARLDLICGRSMISLPGLRYMELIGLPKLTELPAGLQSSRSLHYLMIADCMSLKSTDHVLQHLHTLQKLCVYDCPNLWIAPDVFQHLTALKSLDIRNCARITITSTSNTGKHEAPFVSHIPEIILDGQQLLHQTAGLSEESDAALGPQMPSFRVQTDSFSPKTFPHFILSWENFTALESSQGWLDEKYKLKVPSKWRTVRPTLMALLNMRVLYRQGLYCCLFPSDYEFERDKMVQLLMAIGLFPKSREYDRKQDKEHFANKRFKRLLDEKCINESRTDVVTGISKYNINVGKVIALSNRFKSRAKYGLIEDEGVRWDPPSKGTEVDNISTYLHHVSVVSNNVDEKVFETLGRYNELRSVLFIRDCGSSIKQVPSTFFTALPLMRALDLSGSHISELPSSIGNMSCLRFLDLSFTLIERIPESIQCAKKLKTLKLKGCKRLHALPKGIKKLVKLQHLDFDVLGQLTSMPEGLGNLTKLRTLSAFIVNENGCNISDLSPMDELSGSLCISGLEYVGALDASKAHMKRKQHLTRLHLKWNDSKYDTSYDGRSSLSLEHMLDLTPVSLVELKFSNFPGPRFPRSTPGRWWYEQHQKLESVTFYNCKNKAFPLQWLPKLRLLDIHDMNGVEVIESTACDWNIVKFPYMETLEIDGMNSLRSWNGVEDGDFPCLSKLSIKHCPKLEGLPFLPHLRFLEYLEISHCKSFESLPDGNLPTSLETLIIINCPSLKVRCSKNGEDWEKIKHVPNIWINMKKIRSGTEDEYECSDVSEDTSDSDLEEECTVTASTSNVSA